MPWIGFVFLMVRLSINQLSRQFLNNPNVVDITGAQMVLVMKLSAFCWNVADGALPAEELSDYQKDRAIKQLPSYLDFAGYVLFFPSLFAGPAFDYVDYKRYIETSMFAVPAGIDPLKKPPTRKKRKIPRSGTPAMWKLATGIFWILLFLQLSPIYYNELLTGSKYMDYGFLQRVFILHMLGVTTRLKYYGVWALTEGACILSGLGYRGVDPTTGKVSWDRLRNVDPWGVESAQNSFAYLGNWNMNTNNWLKNYVYLRVTPRGKKPGFRASMATFVTSAFWHGFYPGYYLTFILAGFVQTVAKSKSLLPCCHFSHVSYSYPDFRRYIRPFFLDPKTSQPTSLKIYYDIFSYLMTQLAFSFTTAPFCLLSLQASFLVWSRVYFYAIIGTALSTAFFASPAKPFLIKKLNERKERSGPKLQRTLSSESIASKEPILGLPANPTQDLEEMMQEAKAEFEARQRRGNDLKGGGLKKEL